MEVDPSSHHLHSVPSELPSVTGKPYQELWMAGCQSAVQACTLLAAVLESAGEHLSPGESLESLQALTMTACQEMADCQGMAACQGMVACPQMALMRMTACFLRVMAACFLKAMAACFLRLTVACFLKHLAACPRVQEYSFELRKQSHQE